MKTHSRDHMMTTTTNTTAVMMMARCGVFNTWAHSLLSPLGFRLVFLYILQSLCRVWSTVATSTDTSAIYRKGEGSHSYSNAECHRGSSKFYLAFQVVTPICVDSNRHVVNDAEMTWKAQTSLLISAHIAIVIWVMIWVEMAIFVFHSQWKQKRYVWFLLGSVKKHGPVCLQNVICRPGISAAQFIYNAMLWHFTFIKELQLLQFGYRT